MFYELGFNSQPTLSAAGWAERRIFSVCEKYCISAKHPALQQKGDKRCCGQASSRLISVSCMYVINAIWDALGYPGHFPGSFRCNKGPMGDLCLSGATACSQVRFTWAPEMAPGVDRQAVSWAHGSLRALSCSQQCSKKEKHISSVWEYSISSSAKGSHLVFRVSQMHQNKVWKRSHWFCKMY